MSNRDRHRHPGAHGLRQQLLSSAFSSSKAFSRLAATSPCRRTCPSVDGQLACGNGGAHPPSSPQHPAHRRARSRSSHSFSRGSHLCSRGCHASFAACHGSFCPCHKKGGHLWLRVTNSDATARPPPSPPEAAQRAGIPGKPGRPAIQVIQVAWLSGPILAIQYSGYPASRISNLSNKIGHVGPQ